MTTTITATRPVSAIDAPEFRNADLKIFILGSPRSGTSITYHALKEVLGLPGRGESHVIPIFQRMIHSFYNYAMDFSEMNGVLAQKLDTLSFRKFVSTYVIDFYESQYEGGSWVDKTPGAEAILGAEFIVEAFPSAKILLLRRNGIEIVQSAQKKFSMSFADACQGWANCMSSADGLRARNLPLLELDQFELTNAPDVAARSIATYLERPDRENELAAFFSDRRVDKTSIHDWKRRITLDDVDWTTEQKDYFVDVCGAWMQRMDYPLS